MPDSSNHGFSCHLKITLDQVLSESRPSIALGDIWDQLFKVQSSTGFGIAFMLTSLPSALPLPAPGYSTPFGLLILILAWQWMRGSPVPWLPSWARQTKIKSSFIHGMAQFLTRVFKWVELGVQPRWSWVFAGKYLMGTVIILMAILMIIPIPGTNTFPAFVIFVCGLALTEKDGVLTLLATIGGLISAAIYSVLLFALFYFGASGIGGAWSYLQQLI